MKLDSNECDSEPCQNSGVCTLMATHGYTCDCSEGYEGEYCETATGMYTLTAILIKQV